MVSVSKVSIALPPELAASVQAAVDAGEFASPGEVIRDALSDWTEQRARRAKAIEEIRAAWYEGINSGDPVDGEVFFAELRAEMAAKVAASKRGEADSAE